MDEDRTLGSYLKSAFGAKDGVLFSGEVPERFEKFSLEAVEQIPTPIELDAKVREYFEISGASKVVREGSSQGAYIVTFEGKDSVVALSINQEARTIEGTIDPLYRTKNFRDNMTEHFGAARRAIVAFK
ncbi:hypothetical protein HYZ97_04475 [Candidatus Pacearchaeota archaeon]|nr:hypothetical protein [Candidatus Pacearchaeota archaeon]